MSSNFASHQTTWHNKRISIKGYSVPRHFSWIENYKLIRWKPLPIRRSSHPEATCKKAVLENFSIFTVKHLSWSLLLIKLQAFVLYKKVFVKISQISQENTCAGVSLEISMNSLFNKVPGLKFCNFIIKRLQHKWFPLNIEKFLRTVFYRTPSGGCFWTFQRTELWKEVQKNYSQIFANGFLRITTLTKCKFENDIY